MANPPVPSGIWIRVSSENQSEDNQLSDCEDYCEEQGYLVKRTFCVHGKSAWRPGKLDAEKQAVLEAVRCGDIKVVIVWSVDRWSRGGIADLLDGIRAVKDAGGRVEFVKDSALNVEGPAQELLLAVLGWVAHWESQHRSDRTRNGMERRRAEGAIMGGSVPFGYRLADGKKMRDENALKVVKEVFERSARGESTYTIAEFVRRAGYYRRDNTIPDILRNPVYVGDEVVSGALATRAVAALQSRRTGKVRRIQAEDYSGMVWCVCGLRMHRHLAGGVPAKGVEPTRYYRCKDHVVERDTDGKPKSPTPMVRADDTDALVDIAMSANVTPWMIEIRTGGDTREADKAKVWQEIEKATKRRDMAKVIQLNAELDAIDAREPEPERIEWVPSGKTRGHRWTSLNIRERRAWLDNEGVRLVVWNVKKWHNLPVPVTEDGRLWARGKVRLSEHFLGDSADDEQ